MKTTLISIVSLISTQSLVNYFLQKDQIREAILIASICILAYAVGEVFNNNFGVDDVYKALLLGLLAGALSQIAKFYFSEKAEFIVIGIIISCLFPKQILDILKNKIKSKIEKL